MSCPKKIVRDRINELKSKLSLETNIKLTKVINQHKVADLKIRIKELEYIFEKLE